MQLRMRSSRAERQLWSLRQVDRWARSMRQPADKLRPVVTTFNKLVKKEEKKERKTFAGWREYVDIIYNIYTYIVCIYVQAKARNSSVTSGLQRKLGNTHTHTYIYICLPAKLAKYAWKNNNTFFIQLH